MLRRSGLFRKAFPLFTLLLAACQASPAPDVPYVPTPRLVVTAMLALSGAGPGDVLYDLGSGDGRIVITAVRNFGVDRAVGIEIDPGLVAEARSKALEARVASRVRFIEGDLFETDFSDATVVTLYLLPGLNEKLRPRLLRDLAPGSRIVSHEFDMDGWTPDGKRMARDTPVYLWIVPADIGGAWQGTAGGQPMRLTMQQDYQEVRGRFEGPGGAAAIEDGILNGRSFRFTATLPETEGRSRPLSFKGTVTGHYIEGTLTFDGRAVPVRLHRSE